MPTEPANPRQDRSLYILVGVVLCFLLVGTSAFLWFTGGNPGRAVIGGPFTLVNGDGRTVTNRDFRGKYLLVYFGYTFCPDVCPTSLNAVAEALDRLGPRADKIQPVLITVDPARDTPEIVRQYAAAFGPRIMGLTGSKEQIEAAAKSYRVYYREHRTGPGPNDYSMDHSSILYLVGPDGDFIAPIRAEQPPDEMAAALAKLVR